MLKGEVMSSLLKPDGSKNILHLELCSWNSPPPTASMSAKKTERKLQKEVHVKLNVSLFLPSLGGTQYSASPSSSSLSKDDPSVTHPEEGGSMKLWLKVSSGSW